MPSKSSASEPVRAESYVLDPESECYRNSRSKALTARTITLFKFEDKDSGKSLVPLWERSTPEFWERAGYWDIYYDGLHIAIMDITEITGMFLEKDRSWRGGVESILWVHTTKCAYALQLPDPSYEDTWSRVVENWERNHPGLSATFRPVSAMGAKPGWWPGDEEKQWKKLVKTHGPNSKGKGKDKGREEEDDEEDSHRSEGEDSSPDDDDDGGNGGRTRAGTSSSSRAKGKGKATMTTRTRATREPANAKKGGTGGGKRTTRSSVKSKNIQAPAPELEADSNPLPATSEATGSGLLPSLRTRDQISGGVGTSSHEGPGGRPSKRVRVSPPSNAGPSGHSYPTESSSAPAATNDTVASDQNSQNVSATVRPNDGQDSPRPSKKLRTDSVAGNQPSDELEPGTSATTIQPSRTGSSSTAGKKITPASEWMARRREALRVHEEMRAGSAEESSNVSSEKDQAPGSSSTRQPSPPSLGPFPPPTSSPITPSNVWTTRPLTQVAPPTPSQSTEATDGNGGAGDRSEADMSLDSGPGEVAITVTRQHPTPSSQTSHTLTQTSEERVITQAIEASANARRLIEEIESRSQADLTSSADLGESTAELPTASGDNAPSPKVTVDNAVAACTHAREVLAETAGQQQQHHEPSTSADGSASGPSGASGTSGTGASTSPGHPMSLSSAAGEPQSLPTPPESAPHPQPSASAPATTSGVPISDQGAQPVASTSQSQPSTSAGGSDEVEKRMRVLNITLRRRDRKRPPTEKRVLGNQGKQ